MQMATTPGGVSRPGPDRQRDVRRDGGGWLALPAFLLASMVYLEVLLRARTGAHLLSVGLLHAVLFSAVAALLLTLVAGLLAGRARDVVVGLVLTLLTLLFATQLIYYDTFQTFYTVFSATNAGQVTEFAGVIVDKVAENAAWLLLAAVPLLAFLLSRIRVGPRPRHSWPRRGVIVGLLAVVLVAALTGIRLGDRERNSAYDMYYRAQHPVTSVERLGLVTTMRVDLQRNLLGIGATDTLPPPPPVAAPVPHTPGSPPPDRAGRDEAAVTTAVPEAAAPPDLGVNALDIDFEELAAADVDDDELRALHQYFGSRPPSARNEHTGMFEGYNLVLITAEAYSHLAVDPELTPTLHKLTQEGFRFPDAYTPIWGVSTSDGEYVATTGLIPKPGVWSMYQSGDNAMPFALGNQLRRLGYATFAYHNHTWDYYRRDVSHPNLGYDYKGVGNGLDIATTWPGSDVEMIEVTMPEVLAEEPFHAYYMTVSGHLQYNFGGNFIAAKNRELVEDLPYTDAGKAYLATQIELDRALELLLEQLEEAGVAERTLIVVSSDHYPYGLTQEEIEDLAGSDVDGVELYRNSILMYAPGMEPETVDEPVSSLDILPTVSNLLGLEFDSRLLMGRDVFSDAEPLVIFSDRSFLTDLGHYDSITREFTPVEGVDVPEGYVQAIADEVDRRFSSSALVLDRDYYSIVADR
ncbi:LTA synthase family protein [Ornithinimicrobium flavum]|uniref:LTA synthase family protein n=1 Tax=Ornithinimicrobium flavum TaxID=1288636 RepID=UPI00130539F0|nr:LTA synthase family protein [Ornithinimicrobium flavum]